MSRFSCPTHVPATVTWIPPSSLIAHSGNCSDDVRKYFPLVFTAVPELSVKVTGGKFVVCCTRTFPASTYPVIEVVTPPKTPYSPAKIARLESSFAITEFASVPLLLIRTFSSPSFGRIAAGSCGPLAVMICSFVVVAPPAVCLLQNGFPVVAFRET